MESRKMLLMNLCREEMETEIQRMELWTQWGKERVRQIEKIAYTLLCVTQLQVAELGFELKQF